MWYREVRADDGDDRYDCGFVYDQDATVGQARFLVVGWLAIDLIVTLIFFVTVNSTMALLMLAFTLGMER